MMLTLTILLIHAYIGYKWCFNGTHHICWFYSLLISVAEGENSGKGNTDEYGNCIDMRPCLLDFRWDPQTS